MNKVAAFVKLDFLTIKSYLTLKNFFIFVVIAVIFMATSGSATASIGMLMIYASVYASYPFALGEKSNMDLLYITLSINRETAVLGRYLFALIFNLLAGGFALGVSLIALIVMKKELNLLENLISTLILLSGLSLVQFVQLPIYFKLGYSKAKVLALLPLAILPIIAVTGSKLFGEVFSMDALTALFARTSENLGASLLLISAVWLILMFISCEISTAFYKKREF